MAAAAAAAAAAQQQQSHQLHRQQLMQEQAATDLVRQDVLDAFNAEAAASEVIDIVVERATDVMIGNHLDRLAIPYTVRCVVREALDFVRCAFVGRDDGHVTDAHWHVDPLAPRVTVDPWARAAVSVAAPRNKPLTQATIDANTAAAVASSQSQSNARRAAPAASSNKRPGGGKAAANGSGALSSSSATAAGSPNSANASPTGPTGVSSATTKDPSATSGAKKKDASKGGKAGASGGASGGAGGSDRGTPPPAMSLEESEYLEAAKAEQRRRAEVRATHERVSKQLDEVKGGGAFTIDGLTGKVVPIASFDGGAGGRGRGPVAESRYNIGGPPQAPADLGPVKAPPGARRPGPASAPAALPSTAAASAVLPAMGGAAASTRSRLGAKKPEASDFYHEEASYGPMIDSFAAAGGVTMRDRDAVSKGGEVKVPKAKMTRQEYHKIASAQQSMPIDDGFDAPNTSPPGVAVVQSSSFASVPSDGPRRAGNAAPMQQQSTSLAQGGASRPAADDFKTQGVASLPTHKRAGALAPMPGKPLGATVDSSPRVSKREAAKKLAQTSPQRQRGHHAAAVVGDAQFLLDDDEV